VLCAQSAAEAPEPSSSSGPLAAVRDLFCPFSDPKANARFLAITLGGMLCSIATLIHDSYLPVFMRDELGLSNSVRVVSAGSRVRARAAPSTPPLALVEVSVLGAGCGRLRRQQPTPASSTAAPAASWARLSTACEADGQGLYRLRSRLACVPR